MTDIIHTATSYACDRETRELGEDHVVVRQIAESFTLLRQSIDSARYLVRSADAKRMLLELDLFLVDANHDTGLFTVAERAKEAHAEAKVVPIKRPVAAPKLTVVP